MPQSKSLGDVKSKEQRVLANRYQVVKKLGSGNFGVAYLCKDLRNNEEQKVLKEISVGELQPDETVDAMHEARLLSRLNHPGIGGDLDQKIIDYKKKGMHFEEKTVLDWTVQLMMALQYMHSRRVLHRDLKTRNIFLRNNMVKIGDFGISRILMGTADMASTFTGTPYYMSPEVLKHEGYNSKSDVWSVGCILYELCALEHAFSGQGLMGVMYRIVEGEPPELPRKYSRELAAVFKRMLIKEPDSRPSAQEVLQIQFISHHIGKMKDTLTDEYKTKHQSNMNDEKAEQEAKEIAQLLREKSHLEDIRKEETEDPKLKYMSPRERMRLRKIQEADQRKKELEKSVANDVSVGCRATGLQIWITGSKGFYDDDDEDVARTTMKARTSFIPRTSHVMGAHHTFEDRPITPLRDRMVYDKFHSSLDFKDGIPDTDDMANTYYSQFEFDADDDDGGSGDEQEKEERTLVGGQDEMAQYIGHLQGALESQTNGNTVTVADDTVSGAYGPGAREIKIKNLRSQCISQMGEEAFKKAYDYLHTARFSEDKEEQEIMQGLRAFVKNPSDCFLVDQLLFLEEQAKIS
ncbi:hypothetical protein C0Q70_19241 [Pomacea canaliculata]|uniref:non-specific serine/threonine protein kinase n=1 Tax=Pomacea canaliculata TaxID=400727 RepID=A0A2T7NIU3_POMCA|nr:hypothetical protein C0Q70_19241 [Pomacea canaliculata]